MWVGVLTSQQQLRATASRASPSLSHPSLRTPRRGCLVDSEPGELAAPRTLLEPRMSHVLTARLRA